MNPWVLVVGILALAGVAQALIAKAKPGALSGKKGPSLQGTAPPVVGAVIPTEQADGNGNVWRWGK